MPRRLIVVGVASLPLVFCTLLHVASEPTHENLPRVYPENFLMSKYGDIWGGVLHAIYFVSGDETFI